MSIVLSVVACQEYIPDRLRALSKCNGDWGKEAGESTHMKAFLCSNCTVSTKFGEPLRASQSLACPPSRVNECPMSVTFSQTISETVTESYSISAGFQIGEDVKSAISTSLSESQSWSKSATVSGTYGFNIKPGYYAYINYRPRLVQVIGEGSTWDSWCHDECMVRVFVCVSHRRFYGSKKLSDKVNLVYTAPLLQNGQIDGMISVVTCTDQELTNCKENATSIIKN